MIAEIEVDMKQYQDLFPKNLLNSVTKFVEKETLRAGKFKEHTEDGKLILTYAGPELTKRDCTRMLNRKFRDNGQFRDLLSELLGTITEKK